MPMVSSGCNVVVLSADSAPGLADRELDREAGCDEGGEADRDGGAMPREIDRRLIAKSYGQKAEREVPDQSADRDRGGESERADPDGAGKQQEDFEWSGRRQETRNQYRHDAVPLERRHGVCRLGA